MVILFATAEQNMNSVERVIVYGELEPEGVAETKIDPLLPWPSHGAVSFNNVHLSYRPGLPLVLKDVSFDVKPGEKVCSSCILSVRKFLKLIGRLELWVEAVQGKVRSYKR